MKVYNAEGKVVEEFDLKSKKFYDKVNYSLLKQTILMYEANQRQGTASTKKRSEVKGGGRKPWMQKGTGRARAGSIRSPIWRGGGVTFGPKPKDFSYNLPKKLKSKALFESLKAKIKDDEILLLDEFSIDAVKTKKISSILKNLKLDKTNKILLITETMDKKILLSSRNIKNLCLKKAADVNSYDILKNTVIIATKSAFKKILDNF